MKLPKELTTVTPLSKFIAMIFFIAFPLMGFLLGIRYQEMMDLVKNREEDNVSIVRVPTPTPIAIPTVDPSITADWKTYVDYRYGYEIKYPSGWYIAPTAKEGYGAAAIITNYDTNKSSEKIGFTKDMIKLGISLVNKPIEKPFRNWAAESIHETLESSVNKDYGMTLDSQKSISVNGIEGIRYSFKYNTSQFSLSIYLPKNSTDVFSISVVASDSNNIEAFDQILATFKFIDQAEITPTKIVEGQFCGGIAGTQCTSGYRCQLDGTYPDAGGKCLKL